MSTRSAEHVAFSGHPDQEVAVRSSGQRLPGVLRGEIWMAEDFDTLPEDILAAMEGTEAGSAQQA